MVFPGDFAVDQRIFDHFVVSVDEAIRALQKSRDVVLVNIVRQFLGIDYRDVRRFSFLDAACVEDVDSFHKGGLVDIQCLPGFCCFDPAPVRPRAFLAAGTGDWDCPATSRATDNSSKLSRRHCM